MAVVLAGLLTAACGSSTPPKGSIDFVQNYFGGVSVDEPRAAIIGRDALSAGGNAVDAAAAVYFALSVTMPSAAGLGGGGVCVVFDPEKKTAESLDFTNAAPAHAAPPGRWPAAVPGNVRGIFAMHARYGSLNWGQVVRPAERLARFGKYLSRASAYEIRRSRDLLRKDKAVWQVFAGTGGTGAGEGSIITQLDLSVVLGVLSRKGPGDFYSGALARTIVGGTEAAGGWITIDDLRSYRPFWRPAVALPAGDHRIFLPPAPVSGGQVAAALWKAYGESGVGKAASRGEFLGVVADAAVRSYRALRQIPVGNFGTTGFIVVDHSGLAVSCAVTMNGAFGTGRMIRGTGIVAAVPPYADRDGRVTLAPAVIGNTHTGGTFLAAVGSGDASAPSALISVIYRVLEGGSKLTDALNAARAHPATGQTEILVERHAGTGERAALSGRGHAVREVRNLGRVNIMYCPFSMQELPDSCEVKTDPRGFGHAINAEH